MLNYQIFTDATSDMSADMFMGCAPVEILPMEIEMNGKIYTYGPGSDFTVKQFYEMQRTGNFARTSQINPEIYYHSFERYLKRGKDILYFCFSSGMSGTINTAKMVINQLEEKYPERKIVCIDTLCASVGEGLLVREAAQRQAEGMGMQDLVSWIEQYRLNVCHWFTVDTFEHLKHGGRVSAASAMIGTVLSIKPLLHVDGMGKLGVAEKARGRKRAMESQLLRMEQGWYPEVSRQVVIGHGDCPEEAEKLKKMLKDKFPDAEILTSEIGPVIGAHTGPGMLAVIYWGNNR